MDVSQLFQNYSKLTARQPGVFPAAMTGPLPSAIATSALGAGAGYFAGHAIGTVVPGLDRHRLKKTLAIAGGAVGAASSIPDLANSPDMTGGAPYGTEKTADYKFSSTQVNLHGTAAHKLLALAKSIPDNELAKSGREDEPHVTVLYGLHSGDPEQVRKVLKGHGPGSMTLGGLSLFTRHPDFDVLKADVESPHLHNLNAAVRTLPHTNSYPDYHPHATVAYLQKGVGQKYVGRMDLAGIEHPIEQIHVSATSGAKIPVTLNSGTRSGLPDLGSLLKAAAAKRLEKRAYETDVSNVPGFGPYVDRPMAVGPAAQVLLADRLMNPLQRAMTMQVLQDAADSRPHVTTSDLIRAGVRTGLGYVGGNLVGRFMGAVFGLPPDLQHRVAQAGALGGLLRGVGILED